MKDEEEDGNGEKEGENEEDSINSKYCTAQ